MFVLLDLEWIEGTEKHLTQLSALRTDESWNAVASFNAIVNPGKKYLHDMNHMAFGKLEKELFLNGMTEKDCIGELEQWILPDDRILFWAKSNQTYFAELWYRYGKQLCPRVSSLAKYIRNRFARNCSELDVYGLLTQLGEETPGPAHRSSNDVEVLRRLFKAFEITEETLLMLQPKELPVRPPQKELNRNRIERSEYNFIYLKSSKVFHRRSCPNWQRAADEKEICGSIYYATAAKTRAPCGFCKPEPLEAELPAKQPERELSSPTGNRTEQHQSCDSKSDPAEVVRTRLITDTVIELKRKNIVGFCHNMIHPGIVDKKICIEHDCLGKQCSFFEKNPVSSYLIFLENKKKYREQIRKEKRKKRAEANDLKVMQEEWQSFLDSVDSDMQIVRIEKVSPREYTVFYVSDNLFANSNRFSEFFQMIKTDYPHFWVNLRQIRDLDGHFVTREEFAARRHK